MNKEVEEYKKTLEELKGRVPKTLSELFAYEGEWKCIDLKCTHFDGDICTLGFCEPDIFEEKE